MSVMGVDPGLSGALAVYDPKTGALDITDMPTWHQIINKKNRRRVDAVDLLEYFELQKMMGVELVVMESVGGRPQQNASAGFVFGYTVGLIYMACISVRLPIETVSPSVWKKIMAVPGKKDSATKEIKKPKELAAAIVGRADEIFPDHRNLWRGAKGGYKIDRAEAAILAKFAAYQINTTRPVRLADAEFNMIYRNADTGT